MMVLLLLVACGTAPDASTPTSEPTPTPSPAPSPTDAAPSAAPPSATPDEPETDDDSEANTMPPEIAEAARAALADHLGREPDALTLTNSEDRAWSDSALGCPSPEGIYLQVITPGYLLVFEDDAGATYAIHTSDSGEPLILCENGEPTILQSE
jgi:hypothetical protein